MISKYKPSKELLCEMLSFISTKDAGELCGLSDSVIKKLSRKYNLNARALYIKRKANELPIPDFAEKIRKEQDDSVPEPLVEELDEDECLTVPEEVFAEPAPRSRQQKKITKLDSSNIEGMIKASDGAVLLWFYNDSMIGR